MATTNGTNNMREIYTFGVRVLDGTFGEIRQELDRGGVMVVPAAPALATIFEAMLELIKETSSAKITSQVGRNSTSRLSMPALSRVDNSISAPPKGVRGRNSDNTRIKDVPGGLPASVSSLA